MPNFSSDYIIRIYRFDKKKLHHVVGTAEEVGVKGKKAFTTLEELWEILSQSSKRNKKSNGNRIDSKKKVDDVHPDEADLS